MLRWMLATRWAHWFGVPLVRDGEGRFVSRDGVAYTVERAPATGRLATIEVHLVPDACPDGVIPGTRLPGLMVHCRDTALHLEAAVRMLLWRADREARRMAAAGDALGWQAPQLTPSEPVITEELAEVLAEKLSRRLAPQESEEL